MSTITQQVFAAYQAQYDFFNQKLFNGQLPECLLNFSRKGKTWGFFAPKRWTQDEAVRHEISLNPSTLKTREQKDIASTLVHEMAHLWQQEFGEPGKRGFHNKAWGVKMVEIGLMPSNTEKPGGKKTGIQMSHYAIEGGVFEVAFNEMPKESYFPWLGYDGMERAPKAPKKTKYVCGSCDAKVYGKEGLNVQCGNCSSITMDPA